MPSKKQISAELLSAFLEQTALSLDLYVEVLADFEDELKASLANDADDALLCVLVDDGRAAMLLIDWDGSLHRNEATLKKLHAMWKDKFEHNIRYLLPIFTDHISKKNLGVVGIKWLPMPQP